jgi:triacylglycerol lipase
MSIRSSFERGLADDVVFLLPGFFGFENVGGFFYFADRVAGVLESALFTRLGRRVPVCPLSTRAADPLDARQAYVMEQIAGLLPDHGPGPLHVARDARIHLVGHSTGGVDAWLLLDGHTLTGAPWSKAEMALRRRIRTVETLASPLYGTRITESPFARALAATDLGELLAVGHPGDVLETAWKVAALSGALLASPSSLIAVAMNAVLQTPDGREDAAKLLSSVWRDRGLLNDLHPDAMGARHRAMASDLHVDVTCYVTVPGDSRSTEKAETAQARLFDLMYEEASGPYGSEWPAAAERARDALQAGLSAGTVPRIGRPGVQPRVVDDVVNDGIVNTCAQWLDGAALGGVVLADHIDLIGHYERTSLTIEDGGRVREEIVNRGLMSSGSQFGDAELTQLYGAIARCIAAEAR